MNLTTIDTLAFSKRMQKAGLEHKIADELAKALKETQSQSIENFVTKKDLENNISHSESKLEKRIDRLELKMEEVKNELTFKLSRAIYLATGLIISVIGLAVAILKF